MSSLTYLFNIFLQRILSDAHDNMMKKVRLGGRTIIILRFVHYIDALVEEENGE